MNLRRIALELFLDTVRGLNVADAIQACVVRREETTVVGKQTYRLQDFRRVLVVAVGKAAGPMSDALVAGFEEREMIDRRARAKSRLDWC